jgi:membrane protein DedA with SNARE-associated domain
LIVWFSVLVNAGGLPLPAYPILMIAGALSAANGPSVVKILFTAATAALIADVAWYLAGVHVGRRLLASAGNEQSADDSRRLMGCRGQQLSVLFLKWLEATAFPKRGPDY